MRCSCVGVADAAPLLSDNPHTRHVLHQAGGTEVVVGASDRHLQLMSSQWDELIHEFVTVRALSGATLDARTEPSRVAMITEAETAEIEALFDQILREAEAPSAA